MTNRDMPEYPRLDAPWLTIARAIVGNRTVDAVFQEACASIVTASPRILSAQILVGDRFRYSAGFGATGPARSVPLRLDEDLEGVLEVQAADRACLDALASGLDSLGGLLELAWSHLVVKRHLESLANTDTLTGLPNRRTLRRALDAVHERAEAEHTSYALVLFDLDRFKLINDAYGHLVGDEVLLRTSRAIREMMRESDIFGRWGGEEFVCILPDAGAPVGMAFAERVRAEIAALTIELGGSPYAISASFGVAAYPEHAATVEGIIGRADMALYRAKRGGRDRVVVARSNGHGLYSIGIWLVEALQSGKVRAAFQPIVDLQSRAIVGDEVLARIEGAGDELIAADEFIGLAEDMHIAHRIDSAIVPQALKACASRRASGMACLVDPDTRDAAAGSAHPDLEQTAHDGKLEVARYTFVNISPQLLSHADEVGRMVDFCGHRCPYRMACGGSPRPIVLEITESFALHDPTRLRKSVQPFLDAGFQLAIDDFGSGFAPFVYLSELPISFIKIERSLVQKLWEPRGRSLLKGVVHMAELMDATTIAEGVEDEGLAQALLNLGVHWAQGYHFGRPAIP